MVGRRSSDQAANKFRNRRRQIATGQGAQLSFHLNKAMDLGLTRSQVGEVLTTAAFYAGWPPVFSSLPIVKEIIEKRSDPR
jgi:4-carboxymuconolactone decarboxylase